MKILKSNIIIIFGFISLIINIWLFSIIQNHNSGIILANLDQTTIKDFTVNEQKVFKNALIDQLHDNNQHFVTIRPSTYTSTNDAIYFIADIDDLKLTYEVIIEKTNNQDIFFNCPDKALMKYPETSCIDQENQL